MDIRIVRCTTPDPRWVDCRAQLWPESATAEHYDAAVALLQAKTPFVVLLALASAEVIGFAEVLLRRDPVNGCQTSPVAFLEGIWVALQYRRLGVARSLINEAENWASELGCAEFASDALVDNVASHAFHEAAGFTEIERVVCFRKLL
jgi:aminoglycoside 6'-N-acetyltransferase I